MRARMEGLRPGCNLFVFEDKPRRSRAYGIGALATIARPKQSDDEAEGDSEDGPDKLHSYMR